METKYGNWAFIIGVILAIILGLFGAYIPAYTDVITYIVIVLGLIVGFANISHKEATNFLISAIALLAVGTAGLEILPVVGSYIGGVLTKIVAFVAPAAVIVALKAVYDFEYKKK
jgi:hydrogenase/urease accessory protein HupE